MIEIRQTQTCMDWFASRRDRQAQARINGRIRRLLLARGDKKTQKHDIKAALELAQDS